MDNSDFNHILWDCWYFLFLNVYVLLVGKLWYYVILRDFLNCRIVLDLQNYCKGSTESSLIPHAQIPLLSASSISRYICHSYGANIDTLLLNSILYSDFLSFFLKIFFFFCSRTSYHFQSDISLGLGVAFPQTFHFLDDLDSAQIVVGARGGYFAVCPLIGMCLMFSSWLDSDTVFWGGRQQGSSAIQGHITSRVHTVNLT